MDCGGEKGNWGIFDVIDVCWMGDENGPIICGDKKLATIAMQTFSMQLGLDATRLIVKEYDGTGNQKKDEVPTLMTPTEAIKRLERGEI